MDIIISFFVLFHSIQIRNQLKEFNQGTTKSGCVFGCKINIYGTIILIHPIQYKYIPFRLKSQIKIYTKMRYFLLLLIRFEDHLRFPSASPISAAVIGAIDPTR